MKFKYLIILGVIGATAFYVYQDKVLRAKLLGKVHQVAPELNKSTLYKWKNFKGEWQVTDTPPGKGIKFTTISIQDQINVIPAQPLKKKN